MANRKNIPQKIRRKKEARDGEIGKLKEAIRRLKSDKEKLLSEVNTLTQAFNKNVVYLKDMTDDFSVEELVRASKKEMRLIELTPENPKAPVKKDDNEIWKCFDCQVGILHLVRFREVSCEKYFRMCNNPRCKKRTKPQLWNENVKGIKGAKK